MAVGARPHWPHGLRSVCRPVASCSSRRAMATKSKPSIAILDDYLDIAHTHFQHIPSDRLSVRVFRDALPAYTHPHTTQAQRQAIVDRLKPFDIVSTMRERTPFPAALLKELPNLQVLLATGTQFETFDVAAARELGITVAAAPGRGRTDGKQSKRPSRPKLDIKKGGSHPATQHAWALILALARNVAVDDAVMKDPARKGWQTQLAKGLTGATLGVLGLGRLGAAVARIGVLAWGMRAVCWSENLTQEKANRKAEEMGLPIQGGGPDPNVPTFTAVTKADLFRMADVVTLHYVLSDRSQGIVGAKELDLMKDSALLVNTSRGPLIDDQALHTALEKGQIAGAALDVFDIEPLPADSPWRSQRWGHACRSNLLLTPHMGYVEEGIMHTWYEETAENVERWLEGRDILHVLN